MDMGVMASSSQLVACSVAHKQANFVVQGLDLGVSPSFLLRISAKVKKCRAIDLFCSYFVQLFHPFAEHHLEEETTGVEKEADDEHFVQLDEHSADGLFIDDQAGDFISAKPTDFGNLCFFLLLWCRCFLVTKSPCADFCPFWRFLSFFLSSHRSSSFRFLVPKKGLSQVTS